MAVIGREVTLFPFSLAKIGYYVLCADIDRMCEKAILLALSCVTHSLGTVDFRLILGWEIIIGSLFFSRVNSRYK